MPSLDSERLRELLDRAGLGRLQPRTLAAALVLGALAAGFGLWRFWPAAPVPEVAFDANVSEGTPSPRTTETTADPAPNVVVHVAGAVMRPGVYGLPPGSRVVDAINAAGGGLGTAALDSLNLARVVSDGEQVYILTVEQEQSAVPPAAVPAGAVGKTSSGGQIDINRATAAELEGLPGVGPVTAQKIVDDREANGPFAKPEDLMRVSGIGPKTFEAMREMVTCG